MSDVATPTESSPHADAQAECDRIAAEITHLEAMITAATWKASQLEVPDASPAPGELDRIYAEISRHRSRLPALLVAQTTAKQALDAAAAARLAAVTAEVRAALQPFEDKKAAVQALAVDAAKAFAARLDELQKAELDRRVALQRVAPQQLSSGGYDAKQAAEIASMLPKVAEQEEPLFAVVLQLALAPLHERPFWRTRASRLAST